MNKNVCVNFISCLFLCILIYKFLTYILQEIFALLDPLSSLGISLLKLYTVNFIIKCWVNDFQMSLLNKMRNLLELVESILLMMQHYSIEDLSQVLIQVQVDIVTHVLDFLQLGFDALQGIQTHTHILFLKFINQFLLI